MNLKQRMIELSLNNPGGIKNFLIIMTLVLGAFIFRVQVDTDPENMLAEDEFVRIFHNETKKNFSLNDVVVLGVVNDYDSDGVFNPETLAKVYTLSKFAAGLAAADDPEQRVVARDIIAPDNVDSIEQAGPGQVRFDWLMKEPPATREEALEIRDKAMSNPLLKGTMVSEDGKALAIYIPITEKDFAHEVSKQLKDKIKEIGAGDDHFHITGLPVAEDTFGTEMFIQMAISAPLAMGVIFFLLFIFFRKIQLIVSPMIIALVTVISTMGLLIGTGNTLHIMSSMIPIFLMPIAVVDSVHILSEFYDEYQKLLDRRRTIEHVMNNLFMPMFYTSLTSAAGFASLALTPIPPVRVFGIFVAFGIMLAWLLTILFIPAYIMMMKEENLINFGAKDEITADGDKSPLNRHLRWIGKNTSHIPWLVISFNIIVLAIGAIGISRITVNDNPVKWFKKDHEIHVADRVLNEHFGGTYEAYLILSAKEIEHGKEQAVQWLSWKLNKKLKDHKVILEIALSQLGEAVAVSKNEEELTAYLLKEWEAQLEDAVDADDATYEGWSQALDALDGLITREQLFRTPGALHYLSDLQQYLIKQDNVGKSNSVSDVVKKVHQELFEGDEQYYKIPKSQAAVAQTLISYQNSHKPDDLWHLVTPDYKTANIWVQLKSGDNKDMEKVIADVERYLTDNPYPIELEAKWAGLTYINVEWQDQMVNGMLNSFLSSFIVVFIMMAVLFRSPLWGLLAMLPLTFTIVVIYGIIGLIGKDYDMPVAVLSSLTLGLAVDFAIHFLERSRMAMQKYGDWRQAVKEMFEEPARAISRNTIVIAVGFTPLLFAPLVPYQTVGIFLASIMLYSGLATMWVLPSLIMILQKWLFKKLLGD